MDSCAGHDKDCHDPDEQVEVFDFPPNTTSVYQPLDQGIIGTIKTRYKSRMLAKLVDSLANYDDNQEKASRMKNGTKGLEVGYPAHVLDAAVIVKVLIYIVSKILNV